jgi:probable rRNA maturation factor
MPAGATLTLRNRQRAYPLDTRPLRPVFRALLEDLLRRDEFDLGISFVGEPEMTRLNGTFLRHRGSTDVITFDYADPDQPRSLHGEIFICVHEALVQARRFRTSWQTELVRYAVHGVLHLCGYDDRRAGDRRKMKLAEGRLLAHLARQFDWSRVGGNRLMPRKAP